MNFASDNTAGVAPSILTALEQANAGFAPGYGDDAVTGRVEGLFAEIFEREVAVFLVPTGTAANALALAHICPPWGGVLCHADAHIATDECGAPEFFGGGIKLIGLPGEAGKLTPAGVQAALERYSGHVPHQVNAAALSLTQATEAGTTYRAQEVAALAEIAHARDVAVHMDGARFGNALARMNISPAAATWKAGIDVLSLGATKGGALAAEAVVFFDPARAAAMPERRKRGGHLVSKHRFLAAQFEAFFADGLWLALARHANLMADRLAQQLAAIGIAPIWPVEANLLFVLLPAGVHARLQAEGAHYYARRRDRAPAGAPGGADDVFVRLVTSFSTTEAEIDRFVTIARG
jgi:threonine aldolase